MPSNHRGHPTIAFRPDSAWQHAQIEQRAALSGMNKKDYIIRCCIYSNICVVGKKENIAIIIRAVREMQLTFLNIINDLNKGAVNISDLGYNEFRYDLLSLAVTVVDILNGAAYLFDAVAVTDNEHWKSDLELAQFSAEDYQK